ncbi:STAS domain-containing protein [Bacillus solitudinis]|uniref:STAS domain-containing protein n=1 Tax=Bacillus solitudinis TaxID=2014074 RepID=UPI000C243E70|nr:STAS domain-containing protein [Bacillus solitudinis]
MRKYEIEDPIVINELAQIGEAISNNKNKIVTAISDLTRDDNEKSRPQGLVTNDEIFKIRHEFVEMCANVFRGIRGEMSIEEWANALASYAISKGVSLPGILPITKHYRKVLWGTIEDWTEGKEVLSKTIFTASFILNDLLDEAITVFSIAFNTYQEKKINEKNACINEISAPIVPITKDIAILPLIGILIEERANVLMDTTIKQVVNYKLDLIFIDLSGVSIIDTFVASRLLDFMNTLKILGVTPVLSGLRPEMSQTIVSLGINLNSYKVVSNLRQALSDYGALDKTN